MQESLLVQMPDGTTLGLAACVCGDCGTGWWMPVKQPAVNPLFCPRCGIHLGREASQKPMRNFKDLIRKQ